MTSNGAVQLEPRTSPKLPVLREGQSSLVCKDQLPSPPTPREQASEWAVEVRNKIRHCIESETDIPEADIKTLKEELVPIFITCLQHDSRAGWKFLSEVLDLLEPFQEYLDLYNFKAEVFHYLERIVQHVKIHKERLFDLQIAEALHKVFPKEIDQLREGDKRSVKNYCVTIPSVKLSADTPSPRMKGMVPAQPTMLSLPDGTNPYSMFIATEEQIRMVKPLTFGDLRQSLATVAVDTAARESIWSHAHGTIAQALKTELPDDATQKDKSPPEKEQGGYKLTPRSKVSNFTAAERKFKKTPRIEEVELPQMTGREAVAYFVKCHHLGQIKSLFFNFCQSRYFRPYDLICVHKNKVEPEHFVFSTFGVLHVLPDQPSESLLLSEWQREAVLWTAVTSIPFFKSFLIKKMFDRWRANKLYLDYLRQRQTISSTLLHSVPVFGAALLQIIRLLKELITVNFLPFEVDKMYQLSDFENNVNYKNIQAEKILDKFFTYCRMVVDKTAEESFSKLRYCEEQLRKKTYFSKDSLHMQKFKKEQREENLKLARSETGRLGNFVKLVDQMIVEHMFQLTKSQVTMFVSTVLPPATEEPLRDGFFKANLVFTKQDVLGISPSKEKFIKVLTSTLTGIPGVLCSKAVPMDGSIVDPNADTQTNPDDESLLPKSDQAKSSTDIRPVLSERRKSTAATSSIKQDSRTALSEAVSQMGDTMTVVSGAHTERTVPMTKAKSTSGDDDLMLPDMPVEEAKTKEEDEIGIATPDLVLQGDPQSLVVEGEGFMGQYSPLHRANLEEKLEKDAEFQENLKVTADMLHVSMEEIESYCDFNTWLNEINLFCKRWTEKSAREFKGEQAFTIEQKLTELRQWSEKVRNFDRSFQTSNGLFYVDCSHIHDNLLPRLNDIYSELVEFVAEEARTLANSFCTDMKTIIANMKNKQSSVDSFATFAKNYGIYKKNTASYQHKVEYVKSLYEVIRMSYRQLTADEEKYEENVWAAWEAFLLQMQDASEFVNTQTPLMTQRLEDSYQRISSGKSRSKSSTEEEEEEELEGVNLFKKLENEAFELEDQATTGKFLDPEQNPTHILIHMKQIRDKFYDIQRQLQEASKWRESICGEPYDLTFLNEMTVKLDVRQELWKYVEVSTHAVKDWKSMLFKKLSKYVEVSSHPIKDWKSMLFKKMNIRKALEKVIEWQAAAGQLKPYLPLGDLVLTQWFRTLQDFKKYLPILHKLANDALKERHWKAIFVGMNESYDNKRQFTVADLLTYDIEEHAQLVHQIYLGAVAEYDLELKIRHMQKFWVEREFKLAKHIPDSMLQSKEPKRQASPRRRTKLEKYRQERAAAANAGTPRGLNVADDDYYILIEVEELKYQLEDSQISIRGMMQSPYLGDMSTEVESWFSALEQVEEITDLWHTCQKKWLYLLKVFEWPELYKRFKGLTHKFENVHTKFKDWMRVVSNDSKVLTVINHRRGEKGYRLLQGDNLRSLFLRLIQEQEEILKHLSTLMENCRQEFPRLYFLSDEEMVEMMGISRNPQALLPCARKCFPGVTALAFALPPGTASLNSHLDFTLHADKLQVIAMQGDLGEDVPFFAHLEAQQKSTRWLSLLEGIMKNTMATVMQACVQTRMEDGGKHQPIHLLDELQKTKSDVPSEEMVEEVRHTFQHWLLRFPVQCVHITEAILWARSVQRSLDKVDCDHAEELRHLRAHGVAKMDQFIEILKELRVLNLEENVRTRLHVLLSVLVNQSVGQRDALDAMLSEPVVGERSFTWLRTVRYHMDIRNVLRAKQEPLEPLPPGSEHSIPKKTSRSRRLSVITSKSCKMEAIDEPAAPPIRTKTSVTSDFQFSRVSVQQLGNSFHYDYEYLGPKERLVLTPLTDRAYMSLTQALKNFNCGTLIGPAGTGKSDTIKDLAKTFGSCIFPVNCNEEITMPMMTQYMMGMVQSGCWVLFDDTDRLTKGLMSVTAQHLDYLRTALRTLDLSSESQYKIRGQPRSDKKTGVGDAVIRRNSLTTLHPLPSISVSPQLERQKTVPHGFNEKGLVTYFEETWIAEKEQRRHSIEREIMIKESELYSKNKPPPLFYEHARFKGKKASPDYSQLLREAIYRHQVLGNVMFNGKLLQADCNYGCFMTINTGNPAAAVIPETFRMLLRPCALVIPDYQQFLQMVLLCNGYQEYQLWASKLTLFVKLIKMQLPRNSAYQFGMKSLKMISQLSVMIHHDLMEAQEHERQDVEEATRQTGVKIDTPPLVSLDPSSLEEQSIVQALLEVLVPVLETDDHRAVFLGILRDVFPLSTRSKASSSQYQDTKLVNAVRDQLNEDNVKETQEVMDKILQLYSTIQEKESVILSGPAGSGKTTCLGVLARALNRLNYLLFAPDHSKDELSTDRDYAFQARSKLQEMDMDEFLEGEQEFINRLGAPKSEPSKGGKKFRRMTSLLSKVQEAMHELEVKKAPEYAMYPKIDLIRLNPTAMSTQELLGHFENGMWQGGLMSKILRNANFMSDAVKTYIRNYRMQEQSKQKQKAELPSVLLKWVVLDGVLHPAWTEGLNTMLDSERKLSVANGGKVSLNANSTHILFETTNLSSVSPSIIAHTNIIHFGEDIVLWSSLFECWAKTAKSKWIFTSECMKIIIDLALDVFGPTIKFLETECCPALLTDVGHSVAMANRVVPGVQEVTSFIMMYSAMLDKGFSRDEFEKKIRSREPDDETKLIIISRNLVERKQEKSATRTGPSNQVEKGQDAPKPNSKKKPKKKEVPKATTPSSVGRTTSRMTSSSQIEHNIPNYMEQMKCMFAIAYIWAFGGQLHDRYREKFSKFAHDVLYRASHPVRIPLPGSVFDYTVEDGTGAFVRWSHKAQERSKSLAGGGGGYVVTPEVEKYTYLIELLLGSHQPVLLVGQPGVGKTTLIQNMIASKQTSSTIMMSPGMTSAIFQEALMAHIIDLKSKAFNVITSGPQATALPTKTIQKHLFYIDDLNTAAMENGYQPPLELLTQILTQAGCYDRQRQRFQEMNEALILASATLPTCPGVGMGESCHVMSSRLTRLFMNINLFFPNADGILSTFGRNIQHWLEEFPTYSVEHHFEFARALTVGLMELYHRIKEKFKPTPLHAHYVFSLHDISRVVQGILLMSPRSRTRKMMKIKKDKKGQSSTTTSRQTSLDSRGRGSIGSKEEGGGGGPSPPMMKVIAQLWCHECTRTFADRLVTEEDHQWYGKVLEEIVVKQLCSAREDPKVEMAAISEETFSQSGPQSPTVSPPPPAISHYDSEDDGEPADFSLVDTLEYPEEKHTSSESSKSRGSNSTRASRAPSQTSRLSRTSSRKKGSSATPDGSGSGQTEGETEQPGYSASTSDERTDQAGQSETEYETEPDSDTDTDTETETETEADTDTLAGTPRDIGSTAGAMDDSSRGTSRTSGLHPKGLNATVATVTSVTTLKSTSSAYKLSSNGTDSSDVELTDRSVPDRSVPGKKDKWARIMDDYVKGAPRRKQSQRGSMSTSRRVHFKPGLMTDREHIAYFGPLVKLDEIKGGQDMLTNFIFSKYYMTTHTETIGVSVEKGYTDSSEEQLAEALQTCLNVYNVGTSQKLELVFFREALQHAARLSRVLALQGGHAVLLGTSYSTGRATLVRLAAYVAHCKMGRVRRQRNVLYEPKPQTDTSKNLRIVREHIKRACYHTGILGKPTVLLVHEDLGTECLQDVAALMAEGTSPGLYTDDEMQSIVSQMMPGGVQTKKIDKIEQAFERFLKRIRQHLHVVVLLSYRGNSFSSNFKSLHAVMCRYPALLKYSSCVDHFQPWPYEAYVKMATVWLQDERSKFFVPWHPTRRLEQMDMTAKAMAYIHLTSKTAIERQYCHQRAPLRFFSPLTFMEFVHIFRIIAAFIVKQETGNIHQHEQALGKVNEAFGSISEFKREVSDLSPQHKKAVDEIKDLVEQVESQKQDYIGALDKCKEQEQMIEELQGPLEKLRKDAQSEFDKLNPNYKAAMNALEALSRQDLDELRSYREPPHNVKYVVNALCLLFDVPQDWENGKLLMTRENFIQELIFYDKDNIPEERFARLCSLVVDPLFQPEFVRTHSAAAAGICLWVHSIQKYSEIHRTMQPRLKNLLQQEEKFTKAQAKLGQLRVDANRIKSGLERKIQAHRQAVKRAKTVLKHMQNIERKIARAVNLMENMSMQHYMWKSELRKAKHQIFTAPGDALVTAACVCYQGPLKDKLRGELVQDWLDRCKQGNFKLSKTVGQEIYPINSGLDGLFGFEAQKEKDSASEVSSSQTETQSESGMPFVPEVRLYKYQPVVFDTSKYYQSELKRHGSVEYQPTSYEPDDSDDEDEQSPLMTRNLYSLQEILSDFDELSKWRLDNLPTDLHSVQNALLMRVSCYNRKHCWPLLIDPDNQAETWVKAIQTSSNIFSEKDIRDGDMSDTEDLPKVPSSDDKEDGSTPLPPSRGTAITFSDYNTEYPPDDESTSRTVTSSQTMTSTDYTKSMGRSNSRQSWESEQLRPVTSVTASWELYSLHPDQSIEHPEHNLWIIEADDPTLDSRLINAIVHGVTVLITHLERKPIDPLFRGLLLKHFYVDKEGHKVVRVGNTEFRYHANFCLYLSTSVPLFLKGDGLHSMPIHRMCIIDMGLSDEAIINFLLHETMKVERKEFEGQKRSNENDIIRHRQKLAQEHEMIREKTLNLFGPILEDQTMLDSLINCQKEVERNRQILEETRYMGDHLEEKFSHYVPMIMQAAMLYNMVQRMAVLHSYYYMPFYKFVEMFVSVIKSRDRGKGTLGAPASRARELSDAIYTNIFHYVSMMMFEQHFLLLQLLVSLERLRLTRKASAKDLGIFLNGFDKQGFDEAALLENKPCWCDGQAWIDLLVLEQLHHSFHGLRKSLIKNSDAWQEYFQHPVALMNTVPGITLQEMSIFQKCILWKLAKPEKLSEVAKALILYELGNIRTVPDHYNIREVYSYTSNTTPVVFVLPSDRHDMHAADGTKGLPYVSPSHEVKRLAKEIGMEGKVRVMNFGVGGQVAEVKHALEDCLQTGHWLLLQNYHLAEEPELDFFQLIKVKHMLGETSVFDAMLENNTHLVKDIVYTRWAGRELSPEQTTITDDSSSLVTQNKGSRKSTPPMDIADTFRLWITTQSDRGRLIPGVLVQHGIKVTAESTGNFKSTLQKSYRSVAFLLNHFKLSHDEGSIEKTHRIMPLALLHSLLLQQCYYGNGVFRNTHYWSLTDLAMAVDLYKKVMLRCGSSDKVTELVSQVYADHCVDATDRTVVQALVKTLAHYAVMPADQLPSEPDDVIVKLLRQLMTSDEDHFNLKRAVDSLEELTARTFALPEEADTEQTADSSCILGKDMVQVIGAPELFNRVTMATPYAVVARDTAISQYLLTIQNLPQLPETNKNQVYPIDVFLHYEVEGYNKLIELVTHDLILLQRKSRGEILPSPKLNEVIFSINRNVVPLSWTQQSFQSARTVSDWLSQLSIKLKTLRSYILDEKPPVFNLSAFQRPDRFLESVKQTYARRQFKDIDCIEFNVEVMPAGLNPSVPPPEGVFISGLYLNNALWDATRAVLMARTPDSTASQHMPIFWVKPVDISSPQLSSRLYKLYRCPVFCSADSKQHGDSNVVVHFSLPSETTPTTWQYQRAFLTTSVVES